MIRFQRIGRKKAGTYVEQVGTYNPKTKAFTANGDRIKHWMSVGAQVSPSLANLLVEKGIIEGAKTQVIKKKNMEKNVKKAAEEAAAKAAEEAAAKEAAAKAAAEAEAAAAAAAVEEAPAAPAEEAKAEEPAAA